MLEVLMVARQHLQLQVHVHVQRVQHLLDVHVQSGVDGGVHDGAPEVHMHTNNYHPEKFVNKAFVHIVHLWQCFSRVRTPGRSSSLI